MGGMRGRGSLATLMSLSFDICSRGGLISWPLASAPWQLPHPYRKSPCASAGLGCGVRAGVAVGVGVGVGVGAGVGVGLAVRTGVGVGVGAEVDVGVRAGVPVATGVGVGVGRGGGGFFGPEATPSRSPPPIIRIRTHRRSMNISPDNLTKNATAAGGPGAGRA